MHNLIYRAIYWQHLDQPGLPHQSKDDCYTNNTLCSYQHNPPLLARNFINLNNLEQFKQDDADGGFYQFKFEWIEKEDNIEFFNFESGNSQFEWKQRQNMLEAVNTDMSPFDITGSNVQNRTDFLFHGLSWSDDRNYHIMFDGVIDMGVDFLNGAGKQSRNNGWEPLWSTTDGIMRNQKFYSVGSLETYQYAWPLWMGGWITETDVGDHYILNGKETFDPTQGERIMLFADYQRVLFRSPKLTTLKVKDLSCSSP